MVRNVHAHEDNPWDEAGYDVKIVAPERQHRGLDGELQWDDSGLESGE